MDKIIEKSTEKEWYQCVFIMTCGKRIKGIRGIATSSDAFYKRAMDISKDILKSKGLEKNMIIESLEVSLVPEKIKGLYNLNNSFDHDRFINYLDDEKSTNNYQKLN